MDKEKRKQLLQDIQVQKMGIKMQLNKISFLIRQGKFLSKESDALLDRLNDLERLEKEIEKMK